MTDQQTALERQRALYREKNAHLDQFLKIACLKGLNFFLGQAILIIKNRELTH